MRKYPGVNLAAILDPGARGAIAIQDAFLRQLRTADQGLTGALAWPVGSIYISTTPANPALTLGFGVWEPYSAGRALIGFDASDTRFNVGGKTGG